VRDETKALASLIEPAAIEALRDWEGHIRLSRAISLKRLADVAEAWGKANFLYEPPAPPAPPPSPEPAGEPIPFANPLVDDPTHMWVSNNAGHCVNCGKPEAECDGLPF